MIDETLKIRQREGPPSEAWNMLASEAQQGEDDDEMEVRKPSKEYNFLVQGSLVYNCILYCNTCYLLEIKYV